MKNIKNFIEAHSKQVAVGAIIGVVVMFLIDIIKNGHISTTTIILSGVILSLDLVFFSYTISAAKEKKVTEGENAEPEIAEEAVLISSSIYDVDRYKVDENDSNLFHNLYNKDFSIRVVKKGADKDLLIFALSLPHKFDVYDRGLMLATLPKIMDVTWGDLPHCLEIRKSPACNFVDLQDYILRFLFAHLQRKYGWMFEEQAVLIETVPNPDRLCFHLRVETYLYIDLAQRLLALEGIIGDTGGLPIFMEHHGNYEFSIGKAKLYSWDELLPKIKEIFTDYFKGGVKFTGAFSGD